MESELIAAEQER
jgi:hypothetical protein